MHDTAPSSLDSTPRRGDISAVPSESSAFALGGFAAFALLGAEQALYGPLIPAFRTAFHLNAAGAGLILSAHYAGAVLSIIAATAFERRMGIRRQVVVATISLVVGFLILAAAPVWPLELGGALFVGVGYGTLVVRYNSLFASGFGPKSAAMLTLVNAAFGAGALLGPLIVGALLGGAFRLPFLVGGIIAFAVLPLVRAVPVRVTSAEAAAIPLERRTLLLLVAFVSMFFLYVGLEADVGGWEATQLVSHGSSTSAAAALTALFWGALTAGRLLAAPISLKFAPQRIVLVALIAVIALTLLAHLAVLTPIAYAFTGLALAPIFPLCFVWLGHTFPGVRAAPSTALLAALLGGAVFPTAVGRLIAATSPDALPFALAAVASLFLLLAAGLSRHLRSSP